MSVKFYFLQPQFTNNNTVTHTVTRIWLTEITVGGDTAGNFDSQIVFLLSRIKEKGHDNVDLGL